MAKKIRFPLEMDQGVEVRSLEELRNHFSLARVLAYMSNGKLVTWLRDRYADDIADAIEAIDINDSELAQRVCEIFDIQYDEKVIINLEKAEERERKLAILKEYTTEQRFFDVVDAVAFTQDEVYDLLDEEETIIYLCGERFSIPFSKKGITYIGINNPIVVIDSKKIVDLEQKKISLIDVRYDATYQQIINQHNQNKKIVDQEQKFASSTTRNSNNGYYKNSYLNFMLSSEDKLGAQCCYEKLMSHIDKLNYDIDTDIKEIKCKLLEEGLAGLADSYLDNL